MNKNYRKINREDVLVLVVLFPPLSMVLDYQQFGQRYFSDGIFFFTCVTLIGFTIWLISWRIHLYVGQALRESWGDYTTLVKRTLTIFSIYVPMTALTIFSQFILFDSLGLFGYELNKDDLMRALLCGVIFNIICISIHEGTYLFANWKKSLLEAEELKKANLQSQLDGLKSQVNPHFLFNSLNSLSSLISENPVQAEKFLTEMSKVYRYLLQNNEHGLVTLATELKFAKSYFHLLKTRYEEGINLTIAADGISEDYLLPPLTLQLLLENAVKHNAILPDAPLNIEIYIEEDAMLVVKNNLQKKMNAVVSNKVGLANIREKYRLLNQPGMQVTQTDNCFAVTIPLIKKNTYESIAD